MSFKAAARIRCFTIPASWRRPVVARGIWFSLLLCNRIAGTLEVQTIYHVHWKPTC